MASQRWHVRYSILRAPERAVASAPASALVIVVFVVVFVVLDPAAMAQAYGRGANRATVTPCVRSCSA